MSTRTSLLLSAPRAGRHASMGHRLSPAARQVEAEAEAQSRYIEYEASLSALRIVLQRETSRSVILSKSMSANSVEVERIFLQLMHRPNAPAYAVTRSPRACTKHNVQRAKLPASLLCLTHL